MLRYILGFHSDRLNELQNDISELRQSQRALREAAKQIDEFLKRYDFNSKDQIERKIDMLNKEEERLNIEIENQGDNGLSTSTVAEEDQALVNRLTEAIDAKREATLDITERMKEQELLIAEFITMKFKIVRSSTASELLKGAEFDACPVCGTKVNSKGDGVHCVLCKSDLTRLPGALRAIAP